MQQVVVTVVGRVADGEKSGEDGVRPRDESVGGVVGEAARRITVLEELAPVGAVVGDRRVVGGVAGGTCDAGKAIVPVVAVSRLAELRVGPRHEIARRVVGVGYDSALRVGL